MIKRAAVPALPTSIDAVLLGILPACPFILIMAASSSVEMSNPSRRRASIIIKVSLLNKAPSSVTAPSQSAEIINARFVILLEPGSDKVPDRGLSNGNMAKGDLTV